MMKFTRPVFVAFIVVLTCISCKKADDTAITTPTTLVNFINASADTLNLYVNGSRLNMLSSTYPLGSSGYISTPMGEQNYQVKKYKNPAVLFNLLLPFDVDIHSLYVTDATPENTFTTIDTLITIPVGSSLIRFVHTSPQAGNVDVFIGSAVNFKARAFKTATVFLPVKAADYRIIIKKAGTDQVLSDEIRTLQAGRSYTLFTKGGLSKGGATSNTGLTINQ